MENQQPAIKQNNKISLMQLISVGIRVAYESAHIIKNVSQEKELGVILKGINDPVTKADIKARFVIKSALSKFFPGLPFVGEETRLPSQEQRPKFDLKSVNPYQFFNKEILTKLLKNQIKYDFTADASKMCIWVDPLDGTKNYVAGQLDQVTTMLGITYNNRPIAGIISKPFTLVGGKYIFQPTIYCSLLPIQNVFSISFGEKITGQEQLQIHQASYQKEILKIQTAGYAQTTSKPLRSFTGYIDMEFEEIVNGGAGNKFINIVNGDANMYFRNRQISKWDLCAGEALVMALGGSMCNLNGEKQQYNNNGNNLITEGVLVDNYGFNFEKSTLQQIFM